MTSFVPSRCHHCWAEVRFETTRRGNRQMLNPNPSFTEGNIVLIGHGREVRTYVLTEAELNDGQRRYRFTDHHATCEVLKKKRALRGVVIFPPKPALHSGAHR